MSDKKPFFPLYPADFMVATSHWTNAEVGAYFRLLCHQWANGKIPSDEKRISNIVGMHGADFAAMWIVVGEKFKSDGNGGLLNLRMEEVREQVDEISTKRSKAGKIGNEARWGGRKRIANGIAKPSLSKSKSKSKSNKKDKELQFVLWWDMYPRKVGKAAALKKWMSLELPDIDEMLGKLSDQVGLDRSWREGYIPNPATYLNQGRWEDDIDTRPTEEEREAQKQHRQNMRDLGIA